MYNSSSSSPSWVIVAHKSTSCHVKKKKKISSQNPTSFNSMPFQKRRKSLKNSWNFRRLVSVANKARQKNWARNIANYYMFVWRIWQACDLLKIVYYSLEKFPTAWVWSGVDSWKSKCLKCMRIIYILSSTRQVYKCENYGFICTVYEAVQNVIEIVGLGVEILCFDIFEGLYPTYPLMIV